MPLPLPCGTVEGIRGELESTGFHDIDVHTAPGFIQFDIYDKIAGS
jgi:hypothetical protein